MVVSKPIFVFNVEHFASATRSAHVCTIMDSNILRYFCVGICLAYFAIVLFKIDELRTDFDERVLGFHELCFLFYVYISFEKLWYAQMLILCQKYIMFGIIRFFVFRLRLKSLAWPSEPQT